MTLFSNILRPHLILLVLLLVPAAAYADDDNYGSAQALGWVAIGAGTVANVLFMVFNAVKKLPLLKIGMGSEMPRTMFAMYKPMLNFHIMLNSVGFFAGMSHGLLLLRGLDSISLSLAIVMTVSMVSGLVLKVASDRNSKFFGRLVHGQVVLSILLIALVVLHVSVMGADFD
ncbi:MAG TPA: hypothetical protein VLF17_03750 [Candidatus Nitrosotenuis sp.]|nr:hypothetical protein [Candidatus Nitrosotenuis sp.]